MGIPNLDQLQTWYEDANSSTEYKNLTSVTFAAGPQWLSERKIKARWTPLSESSDLERQSSICIRVKQIRTAMSPLADASPLTKDLLGLVNEIQKLHSPQLQDFKTHEIRLLGYADEHDKLQASITLEKQKGVEMGLNQITGLTIVPNVLPRSLCGWPRTFSYLLEEGHNHPIVRFEYLYHMIGEEFVDFPYLYLKLCELGVKVALNHRSAVTRHKVDLLKKPPRSSSFERTDDTFVLLICFCFFCL